MKECCLVIIIPNQEKELTNDWDTLAMSYWNFIAPWIHRINLLDRNISAREKLALKPNNENHRYKEEYVLFTDEVNRLHLKVLRGRKPSKNLTRVNKAFIGYSKMQKNMHFQIGIDKQNSPQLAYPAYLTRYLLKVYLLNLY